MSLQSVMNKQKVNRAGNALATTLDVVFVIDGTGSMQNLLDAVKSNALTLHSRIMTALGTKQRTVLTTRVKVIIYRDVYVDSESLVESDFFTLPEQGEQFRSFVESVRAIGGGDEPESGLEALHTAIHSDWNQDPRAVRRRQIIILMTDASAHALDDPQRAVDPMYPKGMPATLLDLYEEWLEEDYINGQGKRLALFSPNKDPWPIISSQWDKVTFQPCAAGNGISAEKLNDVIDFIAGSL